MMQPGGFLYDADNPHLLSPPFGMTNILVNSYRKELKNTGPK